MDEKKKIMKFTFITSTFNTSIGDFKKMCSSLNDLKYENWNLLYCDDGSTDENIKLYNSALESLNKNKVFRIKNAKNKGINKTKDILISSFKDEIGEYLISLDSDDYVGETFLNNLAEKISIFKPDIIKFKTLNFIEEHGDILSMKKNCNLLQGCDIFHRIYDFASKIYFSSDYIYFSYKENSNHVKENRFLAFAATRLCGPVSTIYSFDFFSKHLLKWQQRSLSTDDIAIFKNLDFLPMFENNKNDYNILFLRDTEYYYKVNSSSSVTKTFTKQELIKEYMLENFRSLLTENKNNENMKYMVFVYYLFSSFENKDKNGFFRKFIKRNIKIKYLKKLTKIEIVAFYFSKNKMSRFLFKLSLLLYSSLLS